MLESSVSRHILLKLAKLLTWGHFWGFLIEYQDIVKIGLKTTWTVVQTDVRVTLPRRMDFFHNLNSILRNLKIGGKIWIGIWKCERLNQRPKEWETADMNCYVPLLGLAMSILLSSFTIPFKCNPWPPLGFWCNLRVWGKWISLVIKYILFLIYTTLYSALQTCISHVFLIPPNSTFLCMIWNDLHVD